jgi:hypothetical protein
MTNATAAFMHLHTARNIISILLLAGVASCGGSSNTDAPPAGDPPPGGQQPPPGGQEPPPGGSGQAPMTMSCVDGTNYQCSGGTVLRIENGVALTDSGVQVYAISTSDLAPDNANHTGADGLRPVSGGPAEIRVARDEAGATSSIYLLLRNLGLSWDGVNERPLIVETFNPTAGRVQLDSDGRVTFLPLPPSSDLSFYDYANLGAAGTQANYANNRYFPRENNPSRCEDSESCPTTETRGVVNDENSGGWRTGGTSADRATAGRLHGDGDVHAGDGPPDANGNPTWLPDGNGFGVPFPGSKGYRDIANRSYRYANLATWSTQDTVLIAQWAPPSGPEHNKVRRGIVSFGDTTLPAQVPASGSARYTGIAYGWYAEHEDMANPPTFYGIATVNADFATGTVMITIEDTVRYEGESAIPVPATMTATTTIGSAATNSTNYATGPAGNGAMSGGISTRFYGPVDASASGPAEVGGTFTLSNQATTQGVIGGFIARRQ